MIGRVRGAHRGEIADRTRHGLAGDEIEIRPRLVVAPLDELIDADDEQAAPRLSDHGAVVARPDDDLAEVAGERVQVARAVADVGEQVGLGHAGLLGATRVCAWVSRIRRCNTGELTYEPEAQAKEQTRSAFACASGSYV